MGIIYNHFLSSHDLYKQYKHFEKSLVLIQLYNLGRQIRERNNNVNFT